MAAETERYLRQSATTWVRSGFYQRAEILERLRERVEDEGVDEEILDELDELLVAEFRKRKTDESGWERETTNDRIDRAFAELNANGIVAMQNAGYTMSEGWEDVNEVARERTPRPRGATFYHGQDLERAIDGQGLMLAYGAYVDGDNDAASVVLAQDICDVLARHGVKTTWDGTVTSRIAIPKFTWQKRLFSKPPSPTKPSAAKAKAAKTKPAKAKAGNAKAAKTKPVKAKRAKPKPVKPKPAKPKKPHALRLEASGKRVSTRSRA